MIRTIGYVRVSTKRQGGEGKVSPATQREACVALAKEHGRKVDHWIEDRESGSHLGRLERLVAFCQAHKPKDGRGLVVCYDRDRWGRFKPSNLAEMFIGQLFLAGWDVQFATQRTTGDDVADGVVGAIHNAQASLYLEKLKLKIVDNMWRHAEAGEWMGKAPYGYAIEGKRLVKGDPLAVRTVKEIFKRFALEGATVRLIRDKLREDKVPSPSGRRWSCSTVRMIVSNEAYLGRIVWRRRSVVENGKLRNIGNRYHTRKDYYVTKEGAHPALIDKATWRAAQRRLGDRSKPRRWNASSHPFWLAGVFTCARCKSPVVGGGGRRPNAKDPDATNFYRCRHGNGSEATCRPSCTVTQRWLEKQVIDVVQRHVDKAIKSGALARALDAVLGDQPAEREPRARLEQRRRELEAARTVLMSKVEKGLFTDEEAADRIATIRAQLAAITSELNTKVEPASKRERSAERERALALAKDLPRLLETASAATKRELIGLWTAGGVLNPLLQSGSLKLRKLPPLATASSTRLSLARGFEAVSFPLSPGRGARWNTTTTRA